jgi:hypothetical protein
VAAAEAGDEEGMTYIPSEFTIDLRRLPVDIHNAILKYLEAATLKADQEAKLAGIRIINEMNNWSEDRKKEFVDRWLTKR